MSTDPKYPNMKKSRHQSCAPECFGI